jgi:hypothetical protein
MADNLERPLTLCGALHSGLHRALHMVAGIIAMVVIAVASGLGGSHYEDAEGD